MKRWEKFELECCDYLNREMEEHGLCFRKKGGSNSYEGDIEVLRQADELPIGKIETKLCPAQSGQFSISEQDSGYVFSEKNVWPDSLFTEKIIRFINEHFEEFQEVKQKGIPLLCNQKWLTEWVKEHYRRKSTDYIMTSHTLHSYKRIFPIDQIDDMFQVRAVVRRKKSGSRHLPKKEREKAKSDLHLHSQKELFAFKEFISEESKTYTYIESKNPLKTKQLSFGEGYYLSKDKHSEKYYIKKKSGTNNINVVFSLKYKGEKCSGGLEYIEEFLGS